MDQLSQALNLAPQPMPSTYSRLHRRTLKNIPRKNRLYLYGVYTLPGFRGTVRDGSEACQGQKPTLWPRTRRYAGKPNSYRQPPAFCPFRPQNRVYCPKNIFYCPKRTKSDKTKPKINTRREWLHSDYMMTSLANKKLCVGGLTGVDVTCGQCRRSVSTRPRRPSLYPGLRNNLMRLPSDVLQIVLKWRDKGV